MNNETAFVVTTDIPVSIFRLVDGVENPALLLLIPSAPVIDVANDVSVDAINIDVGATLVLVSLVGVTDLVSDDVIISKNISSQN